MTGSSPPFRLFVTGTDTGVGKTHVTCLIARQLVAQGLSRRSIQTGLFGGDSVGARIVRRKTRIIAAMGRRRASQVGHWRRMA